MTLKNIQEWTLLHVVFALIALIRNWIGYDILPISALRGMIVLVFLSIAYISIIGVLVSMPWMPGSEKVVERTSQVELLTWPPQPWPTSA